MIDLGLALTFGRRSSREKALFDRECHKSCAEMSQDLGCSPRGRMRRSTSDALFSRAKGRMVAPE